RIASNTQFGNKKLLDGSAGNVATITDGSKLASLNVGGTFAGGTVAASSGIGVQVTAAATQASITSKALALSTTLVGAGSFSINGVNFTTSATDTSASTVAMINGASAQTGVTAAYSAATIVLTSVKYGSTQSINLSDANGVIASGGAGYSTASGTDAT